MQWPKDSSPLVIGVPTIGNKTPRSLLTQQRRRKCCPPRQVQL